MIKCEFVLTMELKVMRQELYIKVLYTLVYTRNYSVTKHEPKGMLLFYEFEFTRHIPQVIT